MQKLTDKTKAMLKKRAELPIEKKSIKYKGEPKMSSINPAKEPKHKRK